MSRPAVAFARAPVFALALSLALAGCIENMGDLKETLGVEEPLPEPEAILAPVAKAQASALSALVGERITFRSEGSRDPQALPVDLAWDFGDRIQGRGPSVSHTYQAPGDYTVRLTVTNTAGLADAASLAIRILAHDGAPTATLRVLDAKGVVTMRGMMGEPFSFEAAASDPEGQPLTHAWDFGDGSTSLDAKASHAYAEPGAFTVTLRVVDKAGQQAVAVGEVLVDAVWTDEGTFDPTDGSPAELAIVAAPAAKSLVVTLSFDGAAGVNDLELVVLDAEGDEVDRTQVEPQPGAPGQATRELEIDDFDAPGAWTVQVVKERGLNVAWTIEVVERL